MRPSIQKSFIYLFMQTVHKAFNQSIHIFIQSFNHLFVCLFVCLFACLFATHKHIANSITILVREPGMRKTLLRVQSLDRLVLQHLQQQILDQNALIHRHARLIQTIRDLMRRVRLLVLQLPLRLTSPSRRYIRAEELLPPLPRPREVRRNGAQQLLEQPQLLQILGEIAVLLGVEEEVPGEQLEDHAGGGPDIRRERVGRVENGLGAAILPRLNIVRELLVLEARVPQVHDLAPDHVVYLAVPRRPSLSPKNGGMLRSLLSALLIIASDGHIDRRSSSGRIVSPAFTAPHAPPFLLPRGMQSPTSTPFTFRKIAVAGGRNSREALLRRLCS